MDSNANLRELRELARQFLKWWDEDEGTEGSEEAARCRIDPNDVYRAGELIEALDQYLSKGGPLPNDWNWSR